jgi:hypothetical protein
MTSALIPTLLLAQAGTPPPSAPAPAAEPWKIIDNSFLVEEAFNQDPKVVQNIFGVTRQTSGDWMATFTQEFPAPGKRHQLSYTLVADSVDSTAGFGDVYLNYRFQVMEEGPGRPAFAPRAKATAGSRSTCRSASSAAISIFTGTAGSRGCRAARTPTCCRRRSREARSTACGR